MIEFHEPAPFFKGCMVAVIVSLGLWGTFGFLAVWVLR